ncbi:Charged multivesicular body protein 1a [Schistosoma japonicum]|nr:Charged multivesicular body protein 1a [Schistosoma japonicum]
MFGRRENNLQNSLIQLKIAAKQVMHLSDKAAKESKAQKERLKKALTSGDIEYGRIYAENAVRKRQESISYLRMASRFDAVQSRVQTALTMNQVVKNIDSVSNELKKATDAMDLEKLEKIMSKFESQFEDLAVRSSTMENSMRSVFTSSSPEQEVNALIKQVTEENNLEVAHAIADAPMVSGTLSVNSSSSRDAEDDALTRRLVVYLCNF